MTDAEKTRFARRMLALGYHAWDAYLRGVADFDRVASEQLAAFVEASERKRYYYW